jgi:hypothetical protein
MKHGIRLALPFSLMVVNQLLLSIDPLLGMIPGKMGLMARSAMDTLHALLFMIIQSEPQNYVHVDVEVEEKLVKVDFATVGIGKGGNS